jgi:hypothetical protein
MAHIQPADGRVISENFTGENKIKEEKCEEFDERDKD